MSNITVDFAAYQSGAPFNASDFVTLADDSSILDALTDAQIDALATNNVDVISATDGVLSWTADQYAHLIAGPVAIDADTFAIMADTGADIAALSATQIGQIAAEGVAVINPSDGVLALSVAQFDALGAMSVDASANFTIADTGANLATMDAGQISALGILGVDHLDATDDMLALSVAQFQALGTVTLTGGDNVTLADTSANLEALSVSDIGSLGAGGIDHIHATDGVLTISLADFNALGSVTLTQSDTVTLADIGATISGLTTTDIDALATGGVDIFDATDNALTFNVAQISAIAADNIALTAADTVTLADTGANLASLTAAVIGNISNVDVIDATDDTLTIAVDQYEAIVGKNIALTAGDTVTISDTAAHLATLAFSGLAGTQVDFLNSTTAYTALTVANLTALGAVVFTGASAVTLTDTGANIAGISDFSVFSAHGVDTLDASDNTLTISEAQFQALGTTTLTGADVVTISDTAANIVGGPNYGTLAAAGIDFLNATTPINVTTNDISNLGAVVFTSGSTVTLADTGAHIAAIANFTTYGTHGVDKIDATNNTLTMNATQFGELGAVTLTAGDTVTISDTAVHLGGLTFSTLAGKNIDFLNSTNAYTNLTVQNVTDLGAVHFTAASNVTLTDTAADIQAVSDFTTFATHGVDTIKSSDNALSLTTAQYSGLGTTHLTTADAVTIADSAANLNTYFATFGAASTLGTALSTNGVDSIHATGGTLSVNGQGALGVFDGNATFLSTDTVTLADTGNTIAVALSTILSHSGHLATLGVDVIDATNNVLNLTAAEYLDLAGNVALTAADTVTISDTAANIEALNTTQIGGLGTNLIDAISVTSGGDLDWSIAQWQALPAGVAISDSGFGLVVDDSESNIEALTGTQLGALATSGAQELASTGGSLNFTVSQAEGFFGTGLAIASGDTGTLADTGAHIAGMTATQIGQLALVGFGTIDASDDVLTLSTAQFSALSAVQLTGADAVTIADTASNIDTFLDGASAGAEIFDNGVNTIHATGGTLSITVNEANNVVGTGAVFLSGDTVTLADTGAHIAAMNFSPLAGLNVDTIDASDNTLSISLDQYNDIAGVVAFTAGNDVTVTGSLDDLSTTDIAAFGTNHVDHLLDQDGFNEVIWTVAQWDALATNMTIDNSAHIATLNFVFDSAANLSAVTATQVANFVAEGAQTWEESPAGDDALVTWTVANTQAMGGSSFSDFTHVTVVDSATNIQAVSDFSIFAAHHIDSIDSTDDTLSITVAQFSGLGATTLTGADAVTLADTAANLNTYLDGSAAHDAFSTNGVDFIHATGGAISVDETALSHLDGTGTVFLSTDTVTFADTGAHIKNADFSLLAGYNVDAIDATDNTLSITLDQYNDIAGVVALTAGDDVTVTGDVDDLSTTDIAAFATNHVDHVLDQDGFNEVIWNVAQWDALTTAVTIDNANHISFLNVVFDSGDNLSAVTAAQIANFVTEGAEVFEGQPPGEESVSWDVAQLQAMGSAVWASTTVTIYDTAAALQAVSDYTLFSSHGITAISATDGSLTLSAAQFGGLGSVTVDAADTFTVADTAANIEAMGTDGYTAMASAGVDFIHAAGGSLTVTYDEFTAISSSSTVFAGADTVILTGTQAQLFDAHPASYFSALGTTFHIDEISLTGTGIGHLAVDQWNALVTGGTTLDEVNVITLLDTADNLGAETAADIEGMDDVIDHWEVSDGQTLLVTKAQLDALADVSINITPTSAVVLFSDTEATVEGLTATQLEGYITEGVNAFRASDTSTLNLSAAQVTAVVDNGAYFVPANTTTLVDTAAAIGGLSAVQYGELVTGFVDAITATNGTLQMSVADFEAVKTALHSGSLTLTNAAQLADTGTTISGLTTTELGQLGSDNITSITATGDVDFTQAQIDALGGVGVSASGNFVLADSEATIEGLSTSAIDNDAAAGVTQIHSIDRNNALHFTVAQAQHILSDGVTVDNGFVTVTDTGAHISSLSFAQLNGMSSAGFTGITDTSGTITWSLSQLNHLTVPLTLNGNGLTLSDTEATLEAQNGSEWAYIASLATNVTASNTHTLNLSVSQIGQLFGSGATFATGDTVTLTDIGTNISGLTAIQIGLLAGLHVDAINASNNAFSLSVAQYGALGTVTLTGADAVTLSDTGAILAGLTATQLAGLGAAGIDKIDATDNAITLTAAQAFAVVNQTSGTVTFAATDTITISDTGADISALSTSDLAALATAGEGHLVLNATDDAYSFSVAQFTALGSNFHVGVGDVVTIADSAANIQALTTVQIAALGTAGVEKINAAGNTVTFSAAQAGAIESAGLVVTDTTTKLSDTGAAVSALTSTQVGGLHAAGFTEIDVTSGDVSFTKADFDGLNGVVLHKAVGGNVILADAASTIGAIVNGGMLSTYTALGVTELHGTAGLPFLFGVAGIDALESSSISVVSGDAAFLRDTGAATGALTTAEISGLAGIGITEISTGTGGAYSWSLAQLNALSGAVTLDSADTVSLADTGAALGALSTSTLAGLAARGIDVLDATDNALTLSVAQYNALGSVVLNQADTVTIHDTAANISGLTYSALAAAGVDFLDATTAVSVTAAQLTALGTVGFTSASAVTLADTGGHIAAENFATIAAQGVDVIDASDNVLSISAAQYKALGAMTLTQADTITLADTGANIAALTAVQIVALAAAGIDKIDASNNVLSLSVAQFAALGTVTLTGADTNTLLDTGANLQTLDFSTLAAKGIDILDASDNLLTLTAAQFQALGTVALKSTDTVTLLDTGANISALTTGQFNALAAKGIDILDATDNAYSLSVAKVEGISASLTLAANDTITVQDSEAHIEAMTSAQMAAAVARGIDFFHATNSTLNLSAAQVSALLGTGAAFASGDAVTLIDTGADIQALSAVQFGQLAAAGVDKIDTTDNSLTLSIAQYEALGSVQLSAGDTNTLAGAYIPGLADLSTTVIAGLGAAHINHIHGTFMFEWSVAQFNALATNITIDTASGAVRLYDTTTNIQSLTLTQIAAFHAEGLAQLEIATHGGGSELDFSVAQTNAITTAGLTFSTDNATTAHPVITDTGAAIAAMTTTQLAAAAADGFTAINATDDALTLSLAQFTAVGSMSFTAADTVTIADSETNIEALTNPQLAAMVSGHVDIIHSTNGFLNVSTAQVGALLGTGTAFASGDTVTLSDAGASIQALGSTQIGELAAAGIDTIDASDNALTLSLAQYRALGAVTLTQTDAVTIQNDNDGLSGMTVADIQALSSNGVDILESINANFSFSVAQAEALIHQTGGGTVSLSAGDAFYVNDTGTNISTLTASDMTALGALGAGAVDLIGSGAIAVNVATFNAAVAAEVAFDAGDNVTLADTGSALQTFLTATNIAAAHAAGVDAVDATDDALTLNKASLDALAANSIVLAAGDTVTMRDTEARLEALTGAQFASYAAQGVDVFRSQAGILSLNESQVAGVLGSAAAFNDTDAVTLADTAAHIQALSAAQFGLLAVKGVDLIDVTSGTLALSAADYTALGAYTIVGGTVTLADTGADIAALAATQLAALTGTGITHIDASDNAISLTVAEERAILSQTGGGTVTFDATDTITIADTGAAIAGLSVAELAALGVDGAGHVVLDASDGTLTLSDAQYNAIIGNSITLTGADNVVLRDTGAILGGLSAAQIGALAAAGIDSIDASDNALALNIAQLQALGTVKLTLADSVTLADTGAHLAALTASQIGALTAGGIDFIDATDDVLSLTIAQAKQLHQVRLTASDTVTLADTGTNISKLTVAAVGQLAVAGIDVIDASNNAITFTLDKYSALGSVQIAANDVLTVNGTTGDDVFQARAGIQVLNGFAGNDTFLLGAGNHTIDGGNGIDTVSYSGAAAGVTVDLGAGTATTGTWTDSLSAIENATGSNQHDTITGSSGVNVIDGGGGDDTLIGGGRGDTLTGGAGADTFVYLSTADSSRTQSDTIMDFSHAEGDKIDVSAIASFTFVGSLDHHANELAVIDLGGGLYKVVGDVNGDGVADLAILVHSSTALVAGDFVL